MSPYAMFGLDRPSRSAGHRPHTDTHIAFYYVDTCKHLKKAAFNIMLACKVAFLEPVLTGCHCWHLSLGTISHISNLQQESDAGLLVIICHFDDQFIIVCNVHYYCNKYLQMLLMLLLCCQYSVEEVDAFVTVCRQKLNCQETLCGHWRRESDVFISLTSWV